MTTRPGARGRVARLLLLPAVWLVLFLGTGELALRVIYRDQGRQTLGGPGERSFEHLMTADDRRGRFDTGPKTTGLPRILAVGDSITWGQGVRRWEDTWPERLVDLLENAGTPHEMAVLAQPGRDIPQHVEEVERWVPEIDPDVFIYQWYVNDLEIGVRRPANVRGWRTWPTHELLHGASYLYYFLDNRLGTLLPPPEQSYPDFMVETFAPGSLPWAEFERCFHQLATRAMASAGTRVLLLYPQVPFRGEYPLASIHERVAGLAGPHLLTIPSAAWTQQGGTLIERADVPGGRALQMPAAAGAALETREYLMPAGGLDVVVTLSQAQPGVRAATLEAIDAATGAVIGAAPVTDDQGGAGWRDVRVRPAAPPEPTLVRLRLVSTGATAMTVARLALPVDYGFLVVDPTEALNTFDTHASIFDAHPNERAHQVLAEQLFAAVRR